MEEINKAKEELKKTTESLQYFYDPRIIKYLNSLLDLQKSILDDDVLKRNELEILASTGLFRKIVKYNLYYGLIECYKRKASKEKMLNLLKIEEIPCDEYSASNMGIYLKTSDDDSYYKLVDFKKEKDIDFKPDHIDVTINNGLPDINKNDIYGSFARYFIDKAGLYYRDFQVTNIEEDKSKVRVLTKNYDKININLKINKYDVWERIW